MYFYRLREVSIPVTCPLWGLQPSHSASIPAWLLGLRQLQQQAKGKTGGNCLFPVRWCLRVGSSRSGSASRLTSRWQGKTEAFPTVAISQWLWSHWKEGEVLPWGGGGKCKLASGTQLNHSRDNGEGFKAFLKTSPWGNLNVSAVNLCLHIQPSQKHAPSPESWLYKAVSVD